jgi:hypothetical protein
MVVSRNGESPTDRIDTVAAKLRARAMLPATAIAAMRSGVVRSRCHDAATAETARPDTE